MIKTVTVFGCELESQIIPIQETKAINIRCTPKFEDTLCRWA